MDPKDLAKMAESLQERLGDLILRVIDMRADPDDGFTLRVLSEIRRAQMDAEELRGYLAANAEQAANVARIDQVFADRIAAERQETRERRAANLAKKAVGQ